MYFHFLLRFLLMISLCFCAKSQCSKGCSLALGSYYVWPGTNNSFIAEISNNQIKDILSFNKGRIPNQYIIQVGSRIEIPFSCDCIDHKFLGHVFTYKVRIGDTYETIATKYYANLTTAAWIQKFNSYDPNNIPTDGVVNVTVNCSCGDSKVSKDYGLFVTYPLLPGDTLESVVSQANFSAGVNGPDLLQRYNPNANFSAGTGRVYVPGKDKDENFPPLKSGKEI